MKPDSITACPFCYAKNPGSRPSFLEYDPKRPGAVICQACGELKIEKLPPGPKIYFSHYVEPEDNNGI